MPPLLCFCKIVFHSVQLRIPLISSLRNIYLRHAVYFYSKNSFSKNIYYVIHLIFKNGINNIFSSQTSFLLVSSNTHASFANKPIKFYRHKSNTGRHFFAVIIFIYDGIFCCRSFFQIQTAASTSAAALVHWGDISFLQINFILVWWFSFTNSKVFCPMLAILVLVNKLKLELIEHQNVFNFTLNV